MAATITIKCEKTANSNIEKQWTMELQVTWLNYELAEELLRWIEDRNGYSDCRISLQKGNE